RSRRNETVSQQSVLVQIGDPLAVLLVRFSARHDFDFVRVGQQQFQSRPLQNIPDPASSTLPLIPSPHAEFASAVASRPTPSNPPSLFRIDASLPASCLAH